MATHLPPLNVLARRQVEQHRRFWLHLSVVVVVLLFSATLATRVSERLLMLVAGAGAATLFLRWPPVGLVVLIGAGPLVPFAIGTGTESSLNISLLLVAMLVALWMLAMMLQRTRPPLPTRVVRPLFGLCVAAVLAFVLGNQPWLAFAQTAPMRAQVGALAIILLSAGVFLMVGHQVQDLRWLQRITWLFIVIGSIYVIAYFALPLKRLVFSLFQRGATGSLFWTWLAALALAQAVFNRELRLPWRLALTCVVLMLFYVAFFHNRAWSSGWLPPLVAIATILWLRTPRLGLLVALGGAVMIGLSYQQITGVVMVGDQEYSVTTRLEAWRILAEIIKVNPILGLGPANYYWYTPLFPILGYSVQFNSHNNYVDIVAQTGILGLMCFLWFAWETARLGWSLRKRAPTGFAQAYVCGTVGGLAGTLVAAMLGDWVLPFVYNIGLSGFRSSMLAWLFLGGLVAVERFIKLNGDSASYVER